MISVPFHQDPQVVRQFISFSRVIGLLMIAVALTVLASWWWGASGPTPMAPVAQVIKANVAVGFAFSGLALLLNRSPGRALRQAGSLLSLLVLGIGAITLGEYVWSVDLGIDHFFADPLARQFGLYPGRMTELVAVTFILLGGQGLLVSTRRWLILREGLAIGLLAIAMAGMASWGVVLAGSQSVLSGHVPIHTATLLLLAALGWMSSAPTTGLTRVATADTLGGTFARRLLLPALLLPLAFTFGFKALQSRLGMPEGFTVAFAALFTGGTIAWLIWWVAALLDQLERQRREAALLRDDARTDALTGLPNRRAFDDALTNLLRGPREHDTMVLAAAARPGQVQGLQRRLWPSGGRCSATHHRPNPARRAASIGSGRALRQRGIHAAAAGHRRRPGHRCGHAHPRRIPQLRLATANGDREHWCR